VILKENYYWYQTGKLNETKMHESRFDISGYMQG